MAFELTKEFIEKLVNQPIVSFQVNKGSNQGDNVQGELKAVTVETATGKTLNLVHKTMASDLTMRYFIVESQTFRVENEFYVKVAPAIEAAIKARCPSNYKLPIPKFYAGFNNDNDDYTTMEDLRSSGYKMADKFVGLNYAEVSVFLKALGRFHAYSYFFVKYEGEKFFDTVLERISKPFFFEPEKQQEFEGMMKGCTDYSIEIASKNWPELEKRLTEKMKGAVADGRNFETMMLTDTKYFPLIIHADLWVNNMMFKYDDGGNPVDVKFIDFQLMRRGNIFEDLLYFFYTSTTPEFRKNHLYDALDIYYQAFTSSLNDIQCPLPIGFTRGFLVDSFINGLLPTYLYMGFAIPMQLGENPGVFNTEEQQGAEGSNGHEVTGGPPGGAGNGVGDGPPPPTFDMSAIPMEVRINGFVSNNRAQLENSPRALSRFLDVTEEMINLKVL